MVKKENFTITETTKIIIEYIFNNPNCTKRELNNALARDKLEKPRRDFTRKTFTRKTINENIKLLLEEKQIIPHDKYKHGDKEYDDKFTINTEILYLYSEIKKKMVFEQIHSINRAKLEDTSIDKHDVLLPLLLRQNYKIGIGMTPNTKKFFFSKHYAHIFNILIESLIYDCFVNNPDLWYCFEKPENMDFEIRIETNFSKDPQIFKSFKYMRDLTLKDKYLNDNQHNKLSKILIPEKDRYLEHSNLELFYAKAKLDIEEGLKEKDKLMGILKQVIKDLKETDLNYVTLVKKKEQDK